MPRTYFSQAAKLSRRTALTLALGTALWLPFSAVEAEAAPKTALTLGMAIEPTGLDPASFTVTADFSIDGVKPGEELASRFREKPDGVRELTLTTPIKRLERGTLTVAVKDRQGNVTRVERTIRVGQAK